MSFIYIIYSKQFGENIYKVGYTADVRNRIKDSCYTTCFYEPCEYKKIWKFSANVANPETIEKALHAELRKSSNCLKNDQNTCTEMYYDDYNKLTQKINNYFENNTLIDTYEEYNTSDENNLYELGEYHGYSHSEDAKCYCCNRPIKNIYVIEYLNNKYYFGIACYTKKYKIHINPNISSIIKKKAKQYNINMNYEEITEIADRKSIRDNNNYSYDILMNLANKKWTDDCTCSKKYKLYNLTNSLCKQYYVKNDYANKDPKFLEYIKSLGIFDITEHKIAFIRVINRLKYISSYFQKNKQIDNTNTESWISHDRAILSGSAGSGKTSSIFGFIDPDLGIYEPSKLAKYFASGVKVLVMTFTGKALSEIKKKYKEVKTKLEDTPDNIKKQFEYLNILNKNVNFKTIDSYLLSMQFVHTNNIPSDNKYDFVIIDEFSMVTLDHLYNVLQSQKFTRVLVIGDENQLDPVGNPSVITYIQKTYKNIIYNRIEGSKRTKVTDLRNLFTDIITKNRSIQSIHENYKNSSVIKFINMDDLNSTIENTTHQIQLLSSTNKGVELIEQKCSGVFTPKKYMCTKNMYLSRNDLILLSQMLMVEKDGAPVDVYIKQQMEILFELCTSADIQYDNISIQAAKIINLTNQNESIKEKITTITQTLIKEGKYYAEWEQLKIELINKIIKHISTDVTLKIKQHMQEPYRVADLLTSNNDIDTYFNGLLSMLDNKEYQNICGSDLLEIIRYLKNLLLDNWHQDNKILSFFNGQELLFSDDGVYHNINLKPIKYLQNQLWQLNKSKFNYEQCNVMTIHKAQGSGYHTIVIDVYNKQLNKKELYTAVTRAKNNIYFVIPDNFEEYNDEEELINKSVLFIKNNSNYLKDVPTDSIFKKQWVINTLKRPNMAWLYNKLIKTLDVKEKSTLNLFLRRKG